MKTDETLIREFQAGDKRAFDALAKKYLPGIHRLFLSTTRNDEDAEDLTQMALFKIYNSLEHFRFEAEFKTYLYRINSNLIKNYFRKKKIRSLFSFLEFDETDMTEQAQKTNRDLDKERLWKHIESLPAKQRLVLILRLSQELPYKQIGEILNMKEGTAKVNYHHAITRLRTLMENEA